MLGSDSSDDELFAALENASSVQSLGGHNAFREPKLQVTSPPSLWSSSDDENYASVGGATGPSENGSARWIGHMPGGHRPRPKKVASFIVGAKIGEGAYAAVREGLNTSTLRVVAVKVVELRRLRKVKGGVENVKREISVHKSLKKHPNLVELVSVHEDEGKSKVYLFLEMSTGCSLEELQKLAPGGRLPPSQVAHYLFQAMTGVLYMHRHGFVHRDLKPGNMLLNSDGKLKIADFGVAERLDQYTADDSVTRTSGSPAFQAPEIAKGDNEYSGTKVDVWALGVTAYYLLTGRIPFDAENLVDLFNLISVGKYAEPVELDKSIRVLLAHMLEVDWHTRWGVEELLKHPWIARAERVPSKEQQAEQGWVDVPRRQFSILDLAQQYVDEEHVSLDKAKTETSHSASEGSATASSKIVQDFFDPPIEFSDMGFGTDSVNTLKESEVEAGVRPSSPRGFSPSGPQESQVTVEASEAHESETLAPVPFSHPSSENEQKESKACFQRETPVFELDSSFAAHEDGPGEKEVPPCTGALSQSGCVVAPVAEQKASSEDMGSTQVESEAVTLAGSHPEALNDGMYGESRDLRSFSVDGDASSGFEPTRETSAGPGGTHAARSRRCVIS